jgi:hypothetical protein
MMVKFGEGIDENKVLMKIMSKTVFITGTNSGFDKATVERFAYCFLKRLVKINEYEKSECCFSLC